MSIHVYQQYHQGGHCTIYGLGPAMSWIHDMGTNCALLVQVWWIINHDLFKDMFYKAQVPR